MKKIRLIAVFVCICAAFYALFYSPRFDAEKILSQSILQERTFQGIAKEIDALDGKIKAFFMEERSVPLVAVSFGFERAGRAYEPKDGVALLTERVLLDGAGKYNRQELREIMKEKGIKIGVSVSEDTLDFSLSYVKKFEQEALDIIKAVLYEAHLNADDLDLTRRQLEAVRQQRAESPQYHLGRLVDESFYGEHPYGKENIPEAKVMNKLSAADIRNYLEQAMGADNLQIGISGDISEEEAKVLLKNIFVPLVDRKGGFDLASFEPVFAAEPVSVDVDFSAQSFVLAVAPGVKRLDEDFYPLYIADYVLGGSGLSSRLNKAVREKNGLTYGIYSYFSNSDAFDGWYISFSATPDKVSQALQILQEVYADFYQKGLTQIELEQAKNALLSSFNLRFVSLFNIAEMLKQMQRQNLGIDFLQKRQGFVEAVELEQVNDAIRRRLPETLDFNTKVRLFSAKGKL